MNKSELRSQMKATLKTISDVDFNHQCERIYEQLFAQEEWLNAKTVALTISRGREINTHPILERTWRDGKRVVVPKCLPKTKGLQFRTLTSYDELEEVYFGLKEPIVEQTPKVESEAIDLIIVPGLLYDKKGYRIGFGGGYYDRFLANFQGHTVSLALNEQMKTELPHEPFDIPVHKIITSHMIYATK